MVYGSEFASLVVRFGIRSAMLLGVHGSRLRFMFFCLHHKSALGLSVYGVRFKFIQCRVSVS